MKKIILCLLFLCAIPAFSQRILNTSCGPPTVLGPVALFPTTELFDTVTNTIFCVPIRQCVADLIVSKLSPGSNFNVQVNARIARDPIFALFILAAQMETGLGYGQGGYGQGGYGGGTGVSCSFSPTGSYGINGYGQAGFGQ